MTNEDVQFIIREIKSIRYYKTRIGEIDATIKRIQDEIVESGEPHCPLGKETGLTHSFSSNNRVLELITEENEMIKLKKHFMDRLRIAEGYKEEILRNCVDTERFFVIDYLNGSAYTNLEKCYSVSNAYSYMRTIVKRINFKGC